MDHKQLTQLYDTAPNIETDDYFIGFAMADTITECKQQFQARYLAQWAARLRTFYVEVGQQLGSPKMRNLLESLDRRGGLGLAVHEEIRKVLQEPTEPASWPGSLD